MPQERTQTRLSQGIQQIPLLLTGSRGVVSVTEDIT